MDLNHNKNIQEYIREICSQVKFRDVHQDIKLELEDHIREISEQYLTQGSSEKEAIRKAIAQMGDADIIGKQLNQVHRRKPEWSILLFSFIFINIGLLAMYFIQRQSLLTYDIHIFQNSLLFSFISLITFICLYFFDYRKLEKYSKHIYLGALLILAITILYGIQLNGSRSWLILGPFSINFVSVSPLLFIVALAGIFNKWDWNNKRKMLQGFILSALPLILILASPSISTGAIYAIACMVVMIVSGADLKKIILISGVSMVILMLSIITKPYQLTRLLTFLNPEADPLGGGYLKIQLSKIISDSGIFGKGFTFNPQLIPNIHTDFVFAFITYTFGWIASILLIAFIVIFLIRIARIARQVKINYAKLLISGFVSILAVQFLWNVSMNLGLVPLSAMGLPFVSYSGSQLVINAATIGIISSIYMRKNISNDYNGLKSE
ncbi:cell division protein FtsW, lipid II flippase [Desulfonispora thiosulfatigenes DSM 11270]|uniref:Cell division protein FtsW, lipid II flippase n=1 Tax=Desulfonispora thiosulfatigenes DSM 11270 TaxID=656914 RepID=A0A1W1V8W6_DESTI|nr:FtsW/RodA/SpoVE family cell cycle protein [Desulfonispora thiosulfatigenes]SMB89768.1 cell division protein FtsW, lipid II flippase [Desulfonispora thiosulfatigenes DSM 11270]